MSLLIRDGFLFSIAAGIFFLSITPSFAVEEVSVTDEPVVVGHYQLNFGTSMQAMQGSFDPYGQYQAFPAGSTAWSLMTNFGGSYRFSKVWEVSASGVIMQNSMTFPTGSMQSTSISGPLMDVRYHLGYWPHLIVHVGFSPSWGYSSRSIAGDPTAALPDDFGNGYVAGNSVHVGVGGARNVDRFRFAFDINTVIPLPSSAVPSDAPTSAAEVSSCAGDRLLLSQGVAYLISPKWSVNGGLRQSWAEATTVGGVEQLGTAARQFSSSLGASYTPDEIWRWTASYSTEYPFYNYNVNGSYAPSVSLGVSYAGI